GTKIYINNDYPKEIRKKRLALMEHLKITKNKGLKARLVYDKILINGEMYKLEENGEKLKQEQSNYHHLRMTEGKTNWEVEEDEVERTEENIREEEITLEEIKKAISKGRNGKAPERDNINTERSIIKKI
ncbi:hypothetical protein ILUMI_15598, partial [Ignelater luminosus]